MEAINDIGNYLVTTPKRLSFGSNHTTTTWLITMTSPAFQPRYNSHTATFVPKSFAGSLVTFLHSLLTLGLDIPKSCRGYAITAVQTLSLFMRLNTPNQSRQGSVAQQSPSALVLDSGSFATVS